MKSLILQILALLLLASVLHAQDFLLLQVGPGPGKGAVLTPCGAGQLDFSVATGCNLVWAGH